MIPVSLTIKGIYSYQDKEQTIDFTKLSSSGLFGIFGAVGSGKSTILEAISFALYGETERLNKRDERGYNMMNLKSDKLLIDFIFINAPDKLKYRFIAKANRNKKKFEDVNTIDRSAFKLMEGEWVPIPAKSAEEICSLSYINFRRTVIIPQGRFQEFLQLGDTDRSKMMKELFHLEKFDLSGKTRALEEKNEAALLHLKGQLDQLADISEEIINYIDNELIETKKVLITTQKNAESLNLEIETQKQLKALFDKITEEEKMLKQLENQRPSIEKLKKDLQEFTSCTARFAASINKLNDLKSNQYALNSSIQNLNNQYQEIEQKLNMLEPVFAGLKQRYENKDELNKKASDCRKILEIRIVAEEIIKLKERLANGDKEIQKTNAKIELLDKNKSALKESITIIKSKQTDLTELSKIKTWFTQLNALKNEFSGLQNESLDIKHLVDAYNNTFAQIALKIGHAQKDFQPTDLAEKIKSNIFQLETEIESCDTELKHLKIKQGLISYSEQLIEGEACPVCGSMHHPEKMKPDDLWEKLNHHEKQLAILKSELKNQLEIEKELNKKLAEINLTCQRAKDNGIKLENLNVKLIKHNESHQFKMQLNEDEVDNAFIDAENQKKQLDKTEKELSINEKQLETELKNKEKYQFALNEINLTLSSKTANYNILSNQVNEQLSAEYQDLSSENLEKKILEIEQDFQKLVKDYHSTEKEIGTQKPEKDKLIGTIDAKQKDLSQLIADLIKSGEKLENEVETAGYKSILDIELILKKQIDLEVENKRISDFENQFYGTNKQLHKLRQEINGRYFDESAFNQKIIDYIKVNNKINELHKKLGSLEKDKDKQEQKLLEKDKLKKEFEKLTERDENIKTLSKMFKGSGFVNYISSVYLQNLVNAANHRFQPLTGQKLRLELTQTNDFVIRDYLNEGKTRSVKTLSGGQTFQASLSLALALADSIHSINKLEDNFFFLDEGFGSLDKNSLATVFESLKSLRHENRIVGIISHVEELQQEIDNYLQIENTPDEGSLIRASWE
jgi:DNA repair protein SbcC/Rad50